MDGCQLVAPIRLRSKYQSGSVGRTKLAGCHSSWNLYWLHNILRPSVSKVDLGQWSDGWETTFVENQNTLLIDCISLRNLQISFNCRKVSNNFLSTNIPRLQLWWIYLCCNMTGVWCSYHNPSSTRVYRWEYYAFSGTKKCGGYKPRGVRCVSAAMWHPPSLLLPSLLQRGGMGVGGCMEQNITHVCC